MAKTIQDSGDLQEPGRLEPTRRGRIGLIVAGSLAAGLVAALILVAAPFIAAQENALTGAGREQVDDRQAEIGDEARVVRVLAGVPGLGIGRAGLPDPTALQLARLDEAARHA